MIYDAKSCYYASFLLHYKAKKCDTEELGNGLFACRDIKKNVQIVLEKPIFKVEWKYERDGLTLPWLFTKNIIEIIYAESEEYEDVKNGNTSNTLHLFRSVLKCRNSKNVNSNTCNKREKEAYDSICKIFEKRLCIIDANSIMVMVDVEELIFKVHDIVLGNMVELFIETSYGLQIVGVIFFNISKVNHSCGPNAKLEEIKNKKDCCMRIVALRDIAEGEQICISYLTDNTQDASSRKLQLKLSYNFVCLCDLCKT